MSASSVRVPLAGSQLSRRIDRRLGNLATYLVLIVIASILLIPFVWMISISITPPNEILQLPPRLIPQHPTLANYPEALIKEEPFPLFFRNTLIIAVLVIVGNLLSCSLSAYGFARMRFPGRDVLFMVLLSTLMVPFISVLVPLFVFYQKLHLISTFWPLVLPAFAGSPFFVFLMRQFFMTIPSELIDAARVDGCSEFGIWWRVMLPLSRPVLAAVAIFAFQQVWNDFLAPLVFLQKTDVKTVILGLYGLMGMFMEYHTVMAATVAVIVPMVIVFFAFQNFFVKGITVTGLKG